MKKYKLSNNMVKVMRFRSTLLLVLCAFVIGAVFALSVIVGVTLCVVVLGAYLFLVKFYFDKLYQNTEFSFDENGIEICKGVFVRKKLYLSKSKIQYAELLRTPVQRLFKTCTIIYEIAGSAVFLNDIDIKLADRVMFNENKVL